MLDVTPRLTRESTRHFSSLPSIATLAPPGTGTPLASLHVHVPSDSEGTPGPIQAQGHPAQPSHGDTSRGREASARARSVAVAGRLL